MKRNLMAKLGLATTLAFGAMVPMTTMVTAVHAEETQPVGPIDGMWDHNNIENLEIKLDGQLKYNGKEQTQKIKVKDGDIELKEDKDYKIEGNKATQPGEYEMKVTGINDFHGEAKVKFTIADKADICDAQISLANALTENGKDQKQEITVTYNGTKLAEGTDYIVEGNVANKAGDYQMTISGINGFKGSRSIGFTVKEAPKQLVDIAKCDVKLENTLTENGKDQKQEITVTYNGTKLAEGTDYTVEGNVANKAGTYKMTVKGMKNYQGSKEVEFKVADKKEEKEEEKSNTGLYVGIGLAGLVAAIAAFLKFKKH